MSLIDQQTEAWNRYAEARRKADQTLKLTDGIEAGRAWHAFLDVFLEKDWTPSSAPNVLRFPETRQ